MLILQQYTTPTCHVCKQHKPMLKALEQDFDGELKVQYIDISNCSDDDAITIVPSYRLIDHTGTIYEVWSGTKSVAWITEKIEYALSIL